MTLPRLAVESPYGRLYRLPITPSEAIQDRLKALEDGLLVPSVTNIVGLLDKPFLNDWYAKLAAEAAVDVAIQHPGLIAKKPAEAKKWIKGAARRYTKEATDLGNVVHDAVEQLSRGLSVDEHDLPERARPYLTGWRKFVDEFQPVFTYAETSCFGEVPYDGKELGYAGTADFICDINGETIVGDYKTGKSVHTEAALQLAALAHASRLIRDDETIMPAPDITRGIVVHLQPDGFSVHPVTLDSPWRVFQQLRVIWGFHAENLKARNPLFFDPPVCSLKDL